MNSKYVIGRGVLRLQRGFKWQLKTALALVLVFGVGGVLFFSQPAAAITNSQIVLTSSTNASTQSTLYSSYKTTSSGKFSMFHTDASDIVSGDTNGVNDVFVRDNTSGISSRVSVDSSGNQANGTSEGVAISENGRFVLFHSYADNLATITGLPVGRTYTYGVYLHDRKTGGTELISFGYSGPTTESVEASAVSEDGRFVYFGKIVSGNNWRAYVKDRLLNTVTELSKASDGTPASTGNTQQMDADCDGRFVVFTSDAANLTPNDTNGIADIFLVDTMGAHDIRNLTGHSASGWGNGSPKISCDGNYVLFSSGQSNLVAGDTNNAYDVFLYDRATDSLEIASLDSGGTQFSEHSGGGYDISADGKYVMFSNTTGSSAHYNQTYLRNRDTDTTVLVSQNSSSQVANQATVPRWLKFDGSELAFTSNASNLGVSNPNSVHFLYRATDLGI